MCNRINIAVCEDDDFDLKQMKQLIPGAAEKLHVKYQAAYFSSGRSLLEAVENGARYDLLILDILMDGIDGIETARSAKRLLPDAMIGFVTSTRSYAVEAFELDALHYLMKPVDEKSIDVLFTRYMESANIGEPVLELDTPHGKLVLPARDILRIESYRKGVAIYICKEREAKFVRKSFTEVAGKLDPSVFLQIARGLAVNMDYIDHISQGICYFSDGTSALISRKEKAQIKAIYNEYLFEKMKNFNAGGGIDDEPGRLCYTVCRCAHSVCPGGTLSFSSL